MLATGANGAAFFAAPISSTIALAGQYGGGRALASPSVARWIAKMPREPRLVEKHIEGLRKIAATQSGALKADVSALYDRLSAGVRAAASDPAESHQSGANQSKGSMPKVSVPQ